MFSIKKDRKAPAGVVFEEVTGVLSGIGPPCWVIRFTRLRLSISPFAFIDLTICVDDVFIELISFAL